MHILYHVFLSHCVIYKFNLRWMCLPSFTSRHVFVVWFKNHCKNETKTSACRERQSWCSLHVEVFFSFCNGFYIKWQKMWRDIKLWRHIQPCPDLYITQWAKYMIPKHAFELGISSVENIDMLLSCQKICMHILSCLQNTKSAYSSTSETKFGNTRGGEIRSV